MAMTKQRRDPDKQQKNRRVNTTYASVNKHLYDLMRKFCDDRSTAFKRVRVSDATNQALIDFLVKHGYLKSDEVEPAADSGEN